MLLERGIPHYVGHPLYCMFILRAISICARELKALLIHPECSQSDQVTDIRLTERQRLRRPFINSPEALLPAAGDRSQLQRTAILSGHPGNYVFACTWVCTQVLCVPRQVSYPPGHMAPWTAYLHLVKRDFY